jgi:hypothetical protein
MSDAKSAETKAPKGAIKLTDALAALRQQLAEAQKEGEKADLRFQVENIELEFQAGLTSEISGEAGVGWWIYTAKAGAKASQQTLQKIKLTMKLVDSDGAKSGPISR